MATLKGFPDRGGMAFFPPKHCHKMRAFPVLNARRRQSSNN